MSETSAINMAHQAHHERQIAAHERITVPSVIARPDTIDAWRHVRMYAPIHSLVAHDPDRSWLTIGDSGADAHWLRSIGAREVTASSISATSLERLKAEGYLDGVDVAAINAERIARDDDSVDFVLCKEAYHHLARPMVGFYEMLRVSRVATILLAEPDGSAGSRPLDWLKSGVKTVLRRGPTQSNRFEPAGNFIYGVALEELWKAATAIQARHVYYTRLNDFFHERISHLSDVQPRAEDDHRCRACRAGCVVAPPPDELGQRDRHLFQRRTIKRSSGSPSRCGNEAHEYSREPLFVAGMALSFLAAIAAELSQRLTSPRDGRGNLAQREPTISRQTGQGSSRCGSRS